MTRRAVVALVAALVVGVPVAVGCAAATAVGLTRWWASGAPLRTNEAYLTALAVHDDYVISERGYDRTAPEDYLVGPRDGAPPADVVTAPGLVLEPPSPNAERFSAPLYEALAEGRGRDRDGRSCTVWIKRYIWNEALLDSYGLSAKQRDAVLAGRLELLVVSAVCDAVP